MNKWRIGLFVLVFCSFPFTALAQQYNVQLSAAEKEHILDGPFKMVSRTEAMPPHVKQAFSTITSEPSFALANPGQKYQVTDVEVDRSLPRRRLVFAGVLGEEWFVHYERGGIGHSYCVLLFKVDPQNRLRFVWGGAGFHGAKNLDQLRQMVDAGQFSDERRYDW